MTRWRGCQPCTVLAPESQQIPLPRSRRETSGDGGREKVVFCLHPASTHPASEPGRQSRSHNQAPELSECRCCCPRRSKAEALQPRTAVQTAAGGLLQRGDRPLPHWPGQDWGQVCLEPTLGGQEPQEPHDHPPRGQKGPRKQTLPKAQGWIPGDPPRAQHSTATSARMRARLCLLRATLARLTGVCERTSPGRGDQAAPLCTHTSTQIPVGKPRAAPASLSGTHGGGSEP